MVEPSAHRISSVPHGRSGGFKQGGCAEIENVAIEFPRSDGRSERLPDMAANCGVVPAEAVTAGGEAQPSFTTVFR